MKDKPRRRCPLSSSSINIHCNSSLQNQANTFRFSSPSNLVQSIKGLMTTISGGKVFEPLLIDKWDPLKSFTTLSDNAIYAPGSNFAPGVSTFANPRFDWKETPEAHIIEADLPGVKKKDVKVEVVEGWVLQINGERKEQEEKTHRWHLHERGNGKFVRQFPLPENVKVDQAKASLKNGVLSVVVPKEEVKKPNVKSIEISWKN